MCAILLLTAVVATGQSQAVAVAGPSLGQPGKDVSWVPTPEALVGQMLELASLTPRDYLIDLGSGDGRTVIAAAKRGARALGIEYDPKLVDLATRTAAAAGVGDRARFVKADLFDADLSQATVITMFLLPDINLKLRPRLLQLAPGTRIVSNTFTMDDWTADQTTSIGQGCFDWCAALLWVVPARIEGAWTWSDGALTVTQTFQMLRGVLEANGMSTTIEAARLRGDQISFTAGQSRYIGRVTGDVIEGTATSPVGSATWIARRQR